MPKKKKATSGCKDSGGSGGWGVFVLSESIHVAPCSAAGDIQAPHTLSANCYCCPQSELQDSFDGTLGVMYTHNQEN
jgi:hypothetical protein